MTTPAPAGPECSICGKQSSIMSVMSFTDYSQQKACPLCAPLFLRTLADAIERMLQDQGIDIGTARPAGEGGGQPPAGVCECGHYQAQHAYDGAVYSICAKCGDEDEQEGCLYYEPAGSGQGNARATGGGK